MEVDGDSSKGCLGLAAGCGWNCHSEQHGTTIRSGGEDEDGGSQGLKPREPQGTPATKKPHDFNSSKRRCCHHPASKYTATALGFQKRIAVGSTKVSVRGSNYIHDWLQSSVEWGNGPKHDHRGCSSSRVGKVAWICVHKWRDPQDAKGRCDNFRSGNNHE